MKKRILIMIFGAILLAGLDACNNNSRKEELTQRLDKLVAIHDKIVAEEQTFFSILDSVNNLREMSLEYHDSIHATAISLLSASYNTFLQQVFDALGQTAALANAGNDEAVDATSVYLLSFRAVVEKDYARMVQLSSLRLDTYGETELEEYTRLLASTKESRQMMEDELQKKFENYSSGS